MTKADSPTERSNARIFRGGGYAARVRPWPGSTTTAHLVTVDQGSDLPSSLLRSWLHELADMGYTVVRSGALSGTARRGYDAVGFVPVQSLRLLRAPLGHRIERRPSSGAIRLRKGSTADLIAVARIDQRAFAEGWGLDPTGIGDALNATPSHRLRVAVDTNSKRIVGFAVTGRAGRASFLQRLAVDPAAQAGGIGGRLVIDAQGWARRWRSLTMTVNTQIDNERALRLYRHTGFVDLAERLTVMERSLDADV